MARLYNSNSKTSIFTQSVGLSAPIEDRLVFGSRADLENPESWGEWYGECFWAINLYKGMIVSVVSDSTESNNGIWYLSEDPASFNITNPDLVITGWKKISSSSGAVLPDGYYFPNAVQDKDGNWYGAVVVGNQVWLGENFNCTRYNNGTSINGGDKRYPNDSSSPIEKYGLLYSWDSVINQNFPMTGWKVPEKSDVDELLSYIKSVPDYYYNGQSENIAKALASVNGWNDNQAAVEPGDPGKDSYKNNLTGFCAMPAGYFIGTNEECLHGDLFSMWTLTADTSNANNKYCLNIEYDSAVPSLALKTAGTVMMSVRLISDLTPSQFRAWYVEKYGTMQHHFVHDKNTIQTNPDGTIGNEDDDQLYVSNVNGGTWDQ